MFPEAGWVLCGVIFGWALTIWGGRYEKRGKVVKHQHAWGKWERVVYMTSIPILKTEPKPASYQDRRCETCGETESMPL